ncbi:MAG: GerMN domain-containing protein, partial [Clostridia bacterium]|nr:GerMN domain-containing protein [Clostridia bacterium]
MRKKLFLTLCLLLTLACCACSQQPPAALVEEAPPGAQAIAAEPDGDAESEFTATLYFPYGDTGLLRQETRQIALAPNETRERALVAAMLEGSRQAGSRALFPEKTQVLSTQGQDGVLFVTFDEALYDRYADEGRVRADSMRRRELAMAALAATLTESGEYRAVQVLVRAENNVGRSMRLRNSFYWLEDDSAAPLLTRQSDSLPTPAACARALLAAWRQR